MVYTVQVPGTVRGVARPRSAFCVTVCVAPFASGPSLAVSLNGKVPWVFKLGIPTYLVLIIRVCQVKFWTECWCQTSRPHKRRQAPLATPASAQTTPSATRRSWMTGDVCLSSCFCPITLCRFKDPVFACDGHTYERHAIERWLAASNISPMTGQQMRSRQLTPNFVMKKVMHELTEVPPTGSRTVDQLCCSVIGSLSASIAVPSVPDWWSVEYRKSITTSPDATDESRRMLFSGSLLFSVLCILQMFFIPPTHGCWVWDLTLSVLLSSASVCAGGVCLHDAHLAQVLIVIGVPFTIVAFCWGVMSYHDVSALFLSRCLLALGCLYCASGIHMAFDVPPSLSTHAISC